MSFSIHSTVPIELLPGIGRRTARVLRQLGVITIGQFTQLPEQLLIELFGPSMRSLYTYVHGLTDQPHRRVVLPASQRSWRQRLYLASQVFSLL